MPKAVQDGGAGERECDMRGLRKVGERVAEAAGARRLVPTRGTTAAVATARPSSR